MHPAAAFDTMWPRLWCEPVSNNTSPASLATATLMAVTRRPTAPDAAMFCVKRWYADGFGSNAVTCPLEPTHPAATSDQSPTLAPQSTK